MSDQSEWLKNNQRQLDADGLEVGVSRQALNELIALSEAQEEGLKVLLGVLGHPGFDMRIGHDSGEWVLATGHGNSYEELCRHEDFNNFLELVREYSDYDGEDGN